jgi:hypothetical protein
MIPFYILVILPEPLTARSCGRLTGIGLVNLMRLPTTGRFNETSAAIKLIYLLIYFIRIYDNFSSYHAIDKLIVMVAVENSGTLTGNIFDVDDFNFSEK